MFFMYTIIDDEPDAALLHKRGILANALESHKDVGEGVRLFNLLSKDMIVDPQGVLDEVHMSLGNYCRKPWNKLRVQLVHTYPWATGSLIAAIFLFALTIVQTAYSVAGYYDQHHNNKGGNSSPPATTPNLPRHP